VKKPLKSRLNKDWRTAHRLWRVRAGLGWAALSSIYGCWSRFQDAMPVGVWVGLSVAMSVALTAAHLLKLPGADDAAG
jgi:hypothetical protein